MGSASAWLAVLVVVAVATGTEGHPFLDYFAQAAAPPTARVPVPGSCAQLALDAAPTKVHHFFCSWAFGLFRRIKLGKMGQLWDWTAVSNIRSHLKIGVRSLIAVWCPHNIDWPPWLRTAGRICWRLSGSGCESSWRGRDRAPTPTEYPPPSPHPQPHNPHQHQHASPTSVHPDLLSDIRKM